MRLDRRSYSTRGPGSRRASFRRALDELAHPRPKRDQGGVSAAPVGDLTSVGTVLALLGRHDPEQLEPEDVNQDRCGYCGGAGCARCLDLAEVRRSA